MWNPLERKTLLKITKNGNFAAKHLFLVFNGSFLANQNDDDFGDKTISLKFRFSKSYILINDKISKEDSASFSPL